jgi:hypothetical protein
VCSKNATKHAEHACITHRWHENWLTHEPIFISTLVGDLQTDVICLFWDTSSKQKFLFSAKQLLSSGRSKEQGSLMAEKNVLETNKLLDSSVLQVAPL